METQLGLDDTVVALDQAIYAKALEVVWKHKEEFKTIVLRMGSFHVTCVFLSVIGKRLKDNGLRDLKARVRIGGLWFTSWHPLRKALQQGLAHSQGYYYFLLVILSFLLLVTFACDTTYLIIISSPTFTVVHD